MVTSCYGLNRREHMQNSSNHPHSVAEVIHKKKEAKKKQETKGQLSVGQLDNRTIGKNSTEEIISQPTIITEVNRLQDNRQEEKSRTRNQINNIEIDEQLQQLMIEGMIEVQFMPYYAKACHVLGIATVNALAINARNGRAPARLFAYKVKGAMSLHFKRAYYIDNSGDNQQ